MPLRNGQEGRRLSVLLAHPGALRSVFWEDASAQPASTAAPAPAPSGSAGKENECKMVPSGVVLMPAPAAEEPAHAASEVGNVAAATAGLHSATAGSHFTLFRVGSEVDEYSATGSDVDSWGDGGSGWAGNSEQEHSGGSSAAGNGNGCGAAAGCELLSGASLGEEVTQLLQHVLLTSAECAHSLEGLEEVAGSTASVVDQLRQDMEARLGGIERQLAAVMRHLGVKEPRAPLQPTQRAAAGASRKGGISKVTAAVGGPPEASKAAAPVKGAGVATRAATKAAAVAAAKLAHGQSRRGGVAAAAAAAASVAGRA